jgi:hypothetical protein
MGRVGRIVIAGLGALAVPPIVAAVARARYQSTPLDANDLRIGSFFDARSSRVTSNALRLGDLVTSYGSLDVDLRGAGLDPDGARIRAIAVFAGLRLIVPSGWDVDVHRVGLLGGVDVQLTPAPPGSPSLRVDAFAGYAGIQVTDRPGDQPWGSEILTDAFAQAEAAALREAAADVAASRGGGGGGVGDAAAQGPDGAADPEAGTAG